MGGACGKSETIANMNPHEGIYLTYASSTDKLLSCWSQEKIPGAIIFGRSKIDIPESRFGRETVLAGLCTDDKTGFFDGVAMFMKYCKASYCEIMYREGRHDVPHPFRLIVHYPGNEVIGNRIEEPVTNKPLDTSDIDAATVIPADCDPFEDKVVTLDGFLAIGNANGVSLKFEIGRQQRVWG